MSTLKALFTLKPYGNQLCDRKAKMWLLLLRSSVGLIAGCEAAAWGFIGYLMGEGTQPWISAILIGGAVGCLIGGLDAAFVMVDLSKMSRSQHPDAGRGRSTDAHPLLSSFKGRFTKAHFGALARVFMVFVSLLITAPFLAQLIFSRDIIAQRQSANNATLSGARTTLLSKYEREQETLRARLRRVQEFRSREIAGQGLSKRYGVGPVAQSLSDQIVALNQQIEASERQEADDLFRFDRANPETLAREYGVALASDGIVARFGALREMEQIPGFRWTENAFRILLAGFFFGLVIFKWYEPRSLEVYFDEELQAAFDDFRAGRYDEFLVDPKETPPEEISPFWFARWYYDTIRLREQAQALKEKLAVITARQSNFESAARQLAGEPGEEMQDLQSRRAEVIEALGPLRAALQKESEVANRIAAEITRCEAELVDAPATIEALAGIRDAASIIAKKNQWEERLGAAKSSQRQHAPIMAEAQRLHDAKATELNGLDTIIATTGRALAELTNSIINARINAVNELSAAHQGK